MPIQKSRYIWMDGKFVEWDEAKVHVITHALHYGTGAFEGIRCYETSKGTAAFRLKDHIERLYNSCRILKMNISYSMEEFVEACKETIRRSGLKSCYIRPIIFRGYGEMGVNPVNAPVAACIAAWPWSAYLGEEGLKKGVRVITSSFTRPSVNSLPTKAKLTGAYLNAVFAKMEATEAGFDEAIMLDADGHVCEGTGENIFVMRNGAIKTVPLYASILGGITRDSVVKISRDLGYLLQEEMFTRDELYIADEIFFTGTAAEVTPVVEVDRRKIADGSPGKVTKHIQAKFFDTVSGKDDKYRDWLDYI